MKIKKALVLTCALSLGLFGLASCQLSGGGSSTQTPTSAPAQDPSISTVMNNNYLSFMGNSKLRVDIMNDNLGLTFKYGSSAIVSKQEIAIAAGSSITFEGELVGDTLTFILVTETSNSSSVYFAPNIEKASLSEFFQTNVNPDIVAGNKVYLAISQGAANWTKGLNADLDAKINSSINMA